MNRLAIPLTQAPAKSDNKLHVLEQELRKDQIKVTEQRNSQGADNAQVATPQQAVEQAIVQPVNVTFNNVPNKLGEFNTIISTMYGTQGLNGQEAEAMVLSTLDARRPIDRIVDTSQDGYNLLANQFSLPKMSEKALKQSKKSHKLGSQYMG